MKLQFHIETLKQTPGGLFRWALGRSFLRSSDAAHRRAGGWGRWASSCWPPPPSRARTAVPTAPPPDGRGGARSGTPWRQPLLLPARPFDPMRVESRDWYRFLDCGFRRNVLQVVWELLVWFSVGSIWSFVGGPYGPKFWFNLNCNYHWIDWWFPPYYGEVNIVRPTLWSI